MQRNTYHSLAIISIAILMMTAFSGCDKKQTNESDSSPKAAATLTEAVTEEPSDKESAEMRKETIAEEKDAEEPSEEQSAASVTKEEMPPKDTPQEAAQQPSSHPVYMGVWGNVGGTGFMFDMNGTTGSYIPYDIAEAKEYGARRQLKLVSYDPKSGKCIINAFLKGKYIGQFSGLFNEEEVEFDEGSHSYQSYGGIFTSVKGAKLEFNFHFD